MGLELSLRRRVFRRMTSNEKSGRATGRGKRYADVKRDDAVARTGCSWGFLGKTNKGHGVHSLSRLGCGSCELRVKDVAFLALHEPVT